MDNRRIFMSSHMTLCAATIYSLNHPYPWFFYLDIHYKQLKCVYSSCHTFVSPSYALRGRYPRLFSFTQVGRGIGPFISRVPKGFLN